MRRILRVASALLLAVFLLAGSASADHGYTHADQIPMAVNFSVRVDFDAAGNPRVVTDYPFESTGATEMNLVYNKGDENEVITLKYRYDTGETTVGTRNGTLYNEDNFDEAYRAMRNGDLTLDDYVYIGTSYLSDQTDWYLAYSRSGKRYVQYSEKTRSGGFNGLMEGGVEKTVFYNSRNEIEFSRMLKVRGTSDLLIEYYPAGDIMLAYVAQNGDRTEIYNYEPSTGLFSGKSITELGFEESDLTEEPLAVESAETRTATVRARAEGEAAVTKAAVRLFGGLLSGLIIGILMFHVFFRRRKENRETRVPEESEIKEEAPETVEPPETKYMSSGR